MTASTETADCPYLPIPNLENQMMVKFCDICQNRINVVILFKGREKHRQRWILTQAAWPRQSPGLGKTNANNKKMDNVQAIGQRKAWVCLEIHVLGYAHVENFTFLVQKLCACEFLIDLHIACHMIAQCKQRMVKKWSLQETQTELGRHSCMNSCRGSTERSETSFSQPRTKPVSAGSCQVPLECCDSCCASMTSACLKSRARASNERAECL